MEKVDIRKILDLAHELQALSSAGLSYSKSPFDKERYVRIRDISAEIFNKLRNDIFEWLFKRVDSSLRQYNDTDSHICSSRARQVNEFCLDDLFPLQKHQFENIEVCIPKNCDEVLLGEYGDYMQLPPPEKRITHSPYVLKFEE